MRKDLIGYFKGRVKSEYVDNLVTDTVIAAGASFEQRCGLRHYVFVIARRQLVDHWRAQGCRRRRGKLVAFDEVHQAELAQIPESGLGLESLLSLPTRHALLQGALEEVPEIYREVVRLWLAGRDNVEIATTLGINYNTARSRLARGKQVLLAAYQAALDGAE